MFSDSQAKKIVGKKWRTILSVTKYFIDDFFSPDKLVAFSVLAGPHNRYLLF